MEDLEREVKNQRVHIDNLMKRMESWEPVIEIYARRNLMCAFSVCVAVLTLLLLLLK